MLKATFHAYIIKPCCVIRDKPVNMYCDHMFHYTECLEESNYRETRACGCVFLIVLYVITFIINRNFP